VQGELAFQEKKKTKQKNPTKPNPVSSLSGSTAKSSDSKMAFHDYVELKKKN